VQDKAVTRIGDDNWIMAYTHIAHDCVVGNHTTMANNTTLGGHVEIGDWVTIGGLCGIHQFVKVGAHAMLGFQSAVSQDVPPFLLVDGNPLAVRGVNVTGLKRRNFSAERIQAIRHMHKLIYREGRALEDAKAAIGALGKQAPAAAEDIALMQRFLAAADRGIAR
jgi:UDP-N-acetylglucosamine acyltransferase